MIDLYAPTISWLERFLSGKGWKWKATLVLVVASLCMHFPHYGYLKEHLTGAEIKPAWRTLIEQRDHPLTQIPQDPGSHLEKTTFRLTVPLLAKVLHLNAFGIMMLSSLMGVLMAFMSLSLAERWCGDRVNAFLFTVGIVFIYAGSAAYFDVWGYCDAYGCFFLLLALYSRNAFVVLLSVLLAAFTDERALIASSIVMLYFLYGHHREGSTLTKWQWDRFATACAGGWSLYFALRWVLISCYGFHTFTGNIGPSVVVDEHQQIAWGLWSGFEGGWLLLLAFFLPMFFFRDRAPSILFLGAFLLVVAVALNVHDITRSMAFGFVILYPAFVFLHRRSDPVHFRVLLFFSALISFIHPMCHMLGRSRLITVEPVLVRMLSLFH